VGLPVISVAASVIFNVFNKQAFPWGGSAGDLIKNWLYNTIGEVGTVGILVVAVLSYIIWRFNPVFKLPSKKDIITADITNQVVAEENKIDTTEEIPATENATATTKANALKAKGIF